MLPDTDPCLLPWKPTLPLLMGDPVLEPRPESKYENKTKNQKQQTKKSDNGESRSMELFAFDQQLNTIASTYSCPPSSCEPQQQEHAYQKKKEPCKYHYQMRSESSSNYVHDLLKSTR